jgi:hypothetical protein
MWFSGDSRTQYWTFLTAAQDAQFAVERRIPQID